MALAHSLAEKPIIMVRLLYKYTDRYDTGIQGSEVVHFDICVDRIFKVHCLKYSLNFQGVSNIIFFFILSTHMEFYPPSSLYR